MVGKDFWNGDDVSPYWSIKLRKSFLPKNPKPCNSDNSRSNQFAAGNNSTIENVLRVGLVTVNTKKRSWVIIEWKL